MGQFFIVGKGKTTVNCSNKWNRVILKAADGERRDIILGGNKIECVFQTGVDLSLIHIWTTPMHAAHEQPEKPCVVYISEISHNFEGRGYCCLLYTSCGTHTQSSVYYEKLLSEMKVRGYELAGNSIEITLVDAGMTNDTTRFVTELQLPVTVGQEYGLRN